MNWDDMKIFLAIVNAGGLKKASRELGIHYTSCSRRIKAFEQVLGVKLFERSTSGYLLTQAGESLLFSAQTIQQEFNDIEIELAGKDLQLEGDICLTIPNGFATHLLMPDICEFMKLYPKIHLEINMTYDMRDLANREADVAVRVTENPPDSLSGKRVARIYQSAYASNQYLSHHNPVKTPESCHWLGWGKPSNQNQWAEKSKFSEISVRGNLYSDVLQLAAIHNNLGIASLACFIGDAAEDIKRIPNAKAVSTKEWVWVLAHKDMMTNAKVRTLITFLSLALEKHKDLIEGRMM